MTKIEYDQLKQLLDKVNSIKEFDYRAAHNYTKEFIRLGNATNYPYATEESGTIEDYFEGSENLSLPKKRRGWQFGVRALSENIELILDREKR